MWLDLLAYVIGNLIALVTIDFAVAVKRRFVRFRKRRLLMFPVTPVAEQILQFNDHLNRWLAAGATLRAHLYVNNFTPNPSNVLTDYTEEDNVNFPGYAPITLTPVGTPYINAGGDTQSVWSDPLFQPTAVPPSPQTIYGYFVTIHPVAGPDTLLYGVRFDVAKLVTLATDAVALDPDLIAHPLSSPVSQ